MTREQAKEYVAYVVDDSGNGRALGEDRYAIIREKGKREKVFLEDGTGAGYEDFPQYPSKLVGWQCGFEPLFVAVHSYMDIPIGDQDAEEMAMEYLEEIGWFGEGGVKEADYIL